MSTALTLVFYFATFGVFAWLGLRESLAAHRRRQAELRRLPQIDTDPQPTVRVLRQDPSPTPRRTHAR